MNELISVIIPIYNVEAYLRRCVDGILRQTYTNLEVILVDDESPDNCPAICDSYALSDPRVRVIHQKNRGLSGARNAGIDIALGKYLIFVDSDDYVTEDFVQRLYEALVSTGSDLAMCKWKYVSGGEIPDPATDTGKTIVFDKHQMMANFYIHDGAYFVVAWNKIYKKELFDLIRYPEGRIHEDEATTYKIFDRIGHAAFIDSCMYGYFTGNDSITRGNFSKKRLDWAWAVHERILFFESRSQYEAVCLPALKAFADGCIDLYFKCVRFLPDAKEEQEQMRAYVREAYEKSKVHGGLPARTAFGYRLFLTAPKLYQKILKY